MSHGTENFYMATKTKKTPAKGRVSAVGSGRLVRPVWSYGPYRAMLYKDGKAFAIVTPNGQGRTNQRDILLNGELFRTCGPRRMPSWLR